MTIRRCLNAAILVGLVPLKSTSSSYNGVELTIGVVYKIYRDFQPFGKSHLKTDDNHSHTCSDS